MNEEELLHKVRVLIVDDEPLIAENLAMYLNNHDFEVAAIAFDYEEAIKALQMVQADIALLDINLEGDKDGIDLARFINTHFQIPFIFLSSYSDKATLDRAKVVQPTGYLVKPFNELSLLTTLEISLSNFAKENNQHAPTLNIEKINKTLLAPISSREFDVIEKIYAGKTNQQIAQELFISLNTLKRHINNAYVKLDVNTRTGAIAKLRDKMK